MSHVFLCYARKDEQFALSLAQVLKDHDVPMWVDQWDIPSGANWDRAIDNALYECACFLIVLSPAAVGSDEVQGELRTALDEQKYVIPVLYQPCRIPRQLRVIQHTDFTSREPDDATAIAELLRILREGQLQNERISKPSGSSIEGISSVAPPDSTIALRPSFRNSIGMEFVIIPAGTFLMGTPADQLRTQVSFLPRMFTRDEMPQHQVIISRPFYLGKTPVTQDQWITIMRDNPSRFRSDPLLPVEKVTWRKIQQFLNVLNEREGGTHYRLPTEAEWEYACRAGSNTAYHFGDDVAQLGEYAWYRDNSGNRTHPVGQKRPNAWGLYDMLGNVWEWCYDGKRNYKASMASDPMGSTSAFADRIMRGGGWYYPASLVRSAYRRRYLPGYRRAVLGFRCASSDVSR